MLWLIRKKLLKQDTQLPAIKVGYLEGAFDSSIQPYPILAVAIIFDVHQKTQDLFLSFPQFPIVTKVPMISGAEGKCPTLLMSISPGLSFAYYSVISINYHDCPKLTDNRN